MVSGMLGGTAQAAEESGGHGLDQAAPQLFSLPLPGGIELPVSNSMLMLFLAVLFISLVVWLAASGIKILHFRLQDIGVNFF